MKAISGFPDGAYLTNRAQQCRSLAQGFRDPILRDRMFELASSYDELAKPAVAIKQRTIKVQQLED